MNKPDWIKEIEEREAKATPAPWAYLPEGSPVKTTHAGCEGSWWNLYVIGMNSHGGSPHWHSTFTRTEDDAEFIANARTDIPRLLSALNKALEALEAATNALEDAQFIFAENAHDRKGQHTGAPRLLNPRNCSGYRDRLRAHVQECRSTLEAINNPQEGE